MGGTSTIGYENADGSVDYWIANDYVVERDLVHRPADFRYLKGDSCMRTETISEYFSEDLFEQEDSVARAVYMLNGDIRVQRWGEPFYKVITHPGRA